MTNYIVRRLLLAIPTLVGVAVLTFFMLRILPGDVVEIRLRAEGGNVSQAAIEAERARLGLDQPLLVQFVDWMQGLEYYNMARRLGKEVIFLSYPGEGHHLGRQKNQIDFQIRMMQFFDHHLKGAMPARWMVDGVRWIDREFENPREMIDGSLWRASPVMEEAGGGS